MALQHDPAAQFTWIQTTGARGSNQPDRPRFTPDEALTYYEKTLSTNGTKLAAVQND